MFDENGFKKAWPPAPSADGNDSVEFVRPLEVTGEQMGFHACFAHEQALRAQQEVFRRPHKRRRRRA